MRSTIAFVVMTAGMGWACACAEEPDRRGPSQAQTASGLTDPRPKIKVAHDRPGKPVIALELPKNADDVVLERLAAFPELEELTFIGDAGMIAGFSPPWGTTDAGLGHLKRLKHLRSLSLPSCEITDEGLSHIAAMTQIQELCVGSNGTTIAKTRHARPPGTRGFGDEFCAAEITDASITHLSKLQNLRSLTLLGTRITDDGFERLKGLDQLHTLDVTLIDGGITERSLSCLGQFPKLSKLRVCDSRDAREPLDANLASLKNLSTLSSLTIFSLRVTDAGLVHLAELSHLKSLKLGHAIAPMPVTDKGLRHLERLYQIETLDLRGTDVSQAGINKLRAVFPAAWIVGDES